MMTAASRPKISVSHWSKQAGGQNRNLPAKSKQKLRKLKERQHACHAVAHHSDGDKAMEEVFHQKHPQQE
jgi:hypothetical protein